MFQKNWQELIKPNKLKTEAGHDAGKVATIVADRTNTGELPPGEVLQHPATRIRIVCEPIVRGAKNVYDTVCDVAELKKR